LPKIGWNCRNHASGLGAVAGFANRALMLQRTIDLAALVAPRPLSLYEADHTGAAKFHEIWVRAV
jgi:hypothetical protein